MKQPAADTQAIPFNVIAFGQTLLISCMLVAILLFTQSTARANPTSTEPTVGQKQGQTAFATAEDVAKTLVDAVSNKDQEMLVKLFGENYQTILPLESIDPKDIEDFLEAWKTRHGLLVQDGRKRLIAVGKNNWTFPIPIVKEPSGWRFDVKEGIERMRIRRIGRNELATLHAVLAYYDAQMEYAEKDRNGDGMLEYAQRFISTENNQDGLYWPTEKTEDPSPLGSLMANHTPGGGYHGYYFRILNAQGQHAQGGAYSYLLNDRMRAGFALI